MLRRARSAGFTLVELVMVLVVVGALSTFALARMTDLTAWRLRAFADQLVAQAAAMLRLALAQRRPVVATISGTGVDVACAAGGTLASLPCPATASPCIAETAVRTVTFNTANSGRGTGVALPYAIETETGLIHTVP